MGLCWRRPPLAQVAVVAVAAAMEPLEVVVAVAAAMEPLAAAANVQPVAEVAAAGLDPLLVAAAAMLPECVAGAVCNARTTNPIEAHSSLDPRLVIPSNCDSRNGVHVEQCVTECF